MEKKKKSKTKKMGLCRKKKGGEKKGELEELKGFWPSKDGRGGGRERSPKKIANWNTKKARQGVEKKDFFLGKKHVDGVRAWARDLVGGKKGGERQSNLTTLRPVEEEEKKGLSQQKREI